MKKHRQYKAHAPGAGVVYSTAIRDLTHKLMQTAARRDPPVSERLRESVSFLHRGDYYGAAVRTGTEAPEDLVLAHSIRFLCLLEMTQLLPAIAEERVLETLSAEAAADASACYSISPEILYEWENLVPASSLQVSISRHSEACASAYILAALDRSERLASEADYVGIARLHAIAINLVPPPDRGRIDQLFSTLLLTSGLKDFG